MKCEECGGVVIELPNEKYCGECGVVSEPPQINKFSQETYPFSSYSYTTFKETRDGKGKILTPEQKYKYYRLRLLNMRSAISRRDYYLYRDCRKKLAELNTKLPYQSIKEHLQEIIRLYNSIKLGMRQEDLLTVCIYIILNKYKYPFVFADIYGEDGGAWNKSTWNRKLHRILKLKKIRLNKINFDVYLELKLRELKLSDNDVMVVKAESLRWKKGFKNNSPQFAAASILYLCIKHHKISPTVLIVNVGRVCKVSAVLMRRRFKRKETFIQG